jgi:hypothetical protein
MNHKENYTNLLNTISGVETKGNSSIIIADCMRFLAQCIEACEKYEGAPKETPEAQEEK